MAHHLIKSGYVSLAERLNRFPQGAPPSELLFKILRMLFSEREAELVSSLPIKPFTAAQAAHIWKMNLPDAQTALDALADRAILLDMEQEDGQSMYCLPPPMAGFFEFSLMRVRHDIDQQALSELFYQYLNVEEDFIRELFTNGETRLGRVFVHEPVLSEEHALQVFDYERASEVIKTATHRAVGVCYCRHKMSHLGKACDAPMDICMTFNATAASLIKHHYARQVDQEECLDLLHVAHERHLVQFGDNARQRVSFLCNCCGCCCEAMIAARRFAILQPVHTTNFLPDINADTCVGCGKCLQVCPVDAMSLIAAHDPKRPQKKRAKVIENLCLGCGVCASVCPQKAISLKSRPARVITPLDSTHRAVIMAIERGMLQHLLFDNRVLWSHRAMAAALGVILRLPPLKQALASQQVKSRYLEALLKKIGH